VPERGNLVTWKYTSGSGSIKKCRRKIETNNTVGRKKGGKIDML